LAAEEVRDQALFAAGLMAGDLGGAPVFPYQPPGLWEERSNGGSNTKVYVQSKGTALYRRSLYTFWKRTSPPPFMTIFDAPERTSCLVRRVATNTPLQALAALNDEQVLECAKHLAVRSLRDPSSTPSRLASLYRRVTARSASPDDLTTLESGLAMLTDRFRNAPNDAADLLKQGAMPADPALNPSELAAWMLVASTVLNLDQTLVRD
jgi:hypothetical protein